MNRVKLKRYRPNIRELRLIEKNLDTLHKHLDEVPTIKGKVSASSKDFPYIEQHVSVEIVEPKEAEKIKKMIRKKEQRKAEILDEQKEIENFIQDISDPITAEIFEAVYMNGEYQSKVGERLGYTQGRISQIISVALKD